MKSSLHIRLLSVIASTFLGGAGNLAVAQTSSDPVAALAYVSAQLSSEVTFTVKPHAGFMKVSWIVPAEGGIAYYELYRLGDDHSMHKVCTVKSVANRGVTAYSFIDLSSSSRSTQGYSLVLVDSQGNRTVLKGTPVLASR